MSLVAPTRAGLDALFAPRGIAVVGASRNPAKLGAVMARSLRGFGGPVLGVNARDADPPLGLYPSVAAAAHASSEPLDLAILCVPAAATAAALAEAAGGGVQAALVCSGGFAEAGGPGVGYQQDLAAVAARLGVRLLGPNTSGFLAPSLSLTASFVPGAAAVPSGRVAVVAASGGVNHALCFLLAETGVGVSLAVGLGNSIDVDAADVLDHLARDDRTGAVALHVESVADGPRLMAAVAALTARMPVVALVVGRNDVADFARSHTGALATSWRTTRAALRQAGAVLVADERSLVDAVSALAVLRLAPRAAAGVGVVTAQAGPGLLLVDQLRGAGVDVPELGPASRERVAALLPPLTFQRNPVDTGRPDESFAAVLAAVAADDGVDLVAGYALSEPDALDLADAVGRSGLPGTTALLLGVGGPPEQVALLRRELQGLGVPALASPSALANAVVAVVTDASAQAARSAAAAETAAESTTRRSSARRSAIHDTATGASAARGVGAAPGPEAGGALDEDAAKSLLGALGIPTPARRACTSRAQAHAALAELPGPVAVKLLDAAVTHKSDVGGVQLGVRTADDLDTALDALDRAGARRYLVESMAPPGLDLLVGAHRDPVFGPVVLVGLGGTVAEALDDVAVRVAPLGHGQALAMLAELAGAPLLDGWRGAPVVDRAAVAATVCALGRLLVASPRVLEVEINPLRAGAGGVLALDAVLTFRPGDPVPDGAPEAVPDAAQEVRHGPTAR